MCSHCWNASHKTKPASPEHDGAGPHERCCFCGFYHASGIYVRNDPAKLFCVHSPELGHYTHEGDG